MSQKVALLHFCWSWRRNFCAFMKWCVNCSQTCAQTYQRESSSAFWHSCTSTQQCVQNFLLTFSNTSVLKLWWLCILCLCIRKSPQSDSLSHLPLSMPSMGSMHNDTHTHIFTSVHVHPQICSKIRPSNIVYKCITSNKFCIQGCFNLQVSLQFKVQGTAPNVHEFMISSQLLRLVPSVCLLLVLTHYVVLPILYSSVSG